MKKIILLIVLFLSLMLIGCNKNKLTTPESKEEFNKVKDFINDDATWDGLYSCYVYDYLYVHTSNSDDDISFVKPIIINLINQDEKDYRIIGEKKDNLITLDITLSNKVYGNMIIEEYKISLSEKTRIEFTYQENDKKYDFFIYFNQKL